MTVSNVVRLLALYDARHRVIGGLGVSGDAARPHNIILDIPAPPGVSPSGFGQPTCINTPVSGSGGS